MKLIMENWKKFISEDVLEEKQSNELRQGLAELRKWFGKFVFSKSQKKDQEQKFIDKYENFVYPRLQTDEDKTAYIKIRDEKIAIAKQYLAIKAAEQKAQTPEDKAKIEQAEEKVDQKAAQIEQAEDAEVTAEPETGAEEEAESPAEPEIEIKPLLDRFFNFLTRTGVLRESIGSLIKALGAKDTKLVGSSLSKNFKREEIKALVKYLEDKENVLSFVNQYFANDPEKDQIIQKLTAQSAEEPAKEGEVEVVDDGRKYTYTDENIQKLKTAYEAFEKGFMTASNRVEQENYWIELRDALNAIGQFREIGRKERAYVGEQLINIFENENQQNFKRIVVDIERLRRDLNDTDETLVNYLKAADAGQYESQAYLARFLAELKDVQNSVKRTVEDVQKVGGFKLNEQEEETAEPKEETFEQKVAKVRGVYEKIKREFSETLTQLDKTNAPELEEFSGRIKDAYDQLESIRYLFSRVGAFAKTSNKDVNELQEDYKIAKGKLTKAMSRTLSDLRAGQVDPNQLKVFLTDLLGVADWISTNFGVGPDEQYRVQGVTVQSDGKDKEEVTQDTDNSGGEPLTPEAAEEAPPDAGMPDPDEVEPAKTPMDELKDFYNNNTQFYNVIIQLYKALGNNDEASIEKIKKLLPQLKKLNENVSNDPKSILNILTKIKIELINLFQEIDLIELTGNIDKKDKIYESIKIFAGLMLATKKMIEAEESKNTSLVDKLKSKINSKIKQLINSIMSFTKDGEEKQAAEEIGASEKTLDKLKKSAANLKIAREKETEKSRQRKIYKSMEKGSDPEDYGKDPTRYMEESNNLLERLIKQELKVLNGKKMVRN